MSALLDDSAVFSGALSDLGVPGMLTDADLFAGPQLGEQSAQGGPAWFTTPDGEQLAGRYALVDASKVFASHDADLREQPDHQAVIAPAERPRAEHEAQVQAIVRDFDPALVGASGDVDTGAPVIGEDGLVEAGNSRAVALQRVYRADGQKAEDYRQFLRDHAGEFGLAPAQVDSMPKPVLVRVRTSPADRSTVGRRAEDFDLGPSIDGAWRELQQALATDGSVDIVEADGLSDETVEILDFLAKNPDAPQLLHKALSPTGDEDGTAEGSDARGQAAAGDWIPDQAAGGESSASPSPGPAGTGDEAEAEIEAELPDGWEEFAPESGTLGIPRAEMPQVRAEHRGAMVNFLNARGVSHQSDAEVDAASLKPTQREFSAAKVAEAAAREAGDRSILVSADGHVLDGHHQWLAARDAGKPVKVIVLDAPIRELVELVKEFPSSEFAQGSEEWAKDVMPGRVEERAHEDHQQGANNR